MPATAPHPLGADVVCELDEWVTELRGIRLRRLDIERTARRLSVPVFWRDLGDKLLGLTLDDGRVFLHQRHATGTRGLFVFAHEVAHVLRQRGHFAAVDGADEEWFADWFARELVLPRFWLM